MKFLELTEYRDGDLSKKVLVNPEEIAAVTAYSYHSFRPAVSKVILKCGKEIKLWEDVAEVTRLVTLAARGNHQ